MTDALRDLSEPEHLSIHDPILRHTFSVESDEGYFSALLDMLTPPDWHDRAACKKPDVDRSIFFPEDNGRGAHKQVKQAKAICATCPVKAECTASALEHHERYGVWGGLARDGLRELRHGKPQPFKKRIGRSEEPQSVRQRERRAALRKAGQCWQCARACHGDCSGGGCTCPRCREEGAA